LREKSKKENDKNLSFLTDYIFEKVFKNYTMKQWGISAEEIDSNVMNRVPIVISKDDRYFSHHKYQ
jgi:UDP-galactopyranose mutase